MASIEAPLKRLVFWSLIAFRMLRFRSVLLMIAYEGIGYEISNTNRNISVSFGVGALIIASIYICATCFNDAADEKIDKINLQKDHSRPLVTTNVTANQLRRLGLFMLVVGFMLAALTSLALFTFVSALTLLILSYSVRPMQLSHRGILASCALACIYAVIPFFIGFTMHHTQFTVTDSLLVIGIFFTFVSRILLKDFRDYIGDKKYHKLNFLVRHGQQNTCLTSAAMWCIGELYVIVWVVSMNVSVIILFILLTIVVLIQLKLLMRESQIKHQLYRVAIISKSGNANVLAILSLVTLSAYSYGQVLNTLIVFVVAIFTLVTFINLVPPAKISPAQKY